MTDKKDQCGFCGKDNQKVCWECCEANTNELWSVIRNLRDRIVKLEEEKVCIGGGGTNCPSPSTSKKP